MSYQVTPQTVLKKAFQNIWDQNPEFGLIATDFSGEAVNFGDTVTSRFGIGAEVHDVVQGTPLTRDGINLQKVQVTLNQFKNISFKLDTMDASKDPDPAEIIANAVAEIQPKFEEVIFGYLDGLVAAATGIDTVTIDEGDGGYLKAVDIETTLNENKAPIAPRFGRAGSSLYGEFKKDQIIYTASTSNGDLVRTGVLPDVNGMTVHRAPTMPNTLRGYFGTKAGLILLSRVPTDVSKLASRPLGSANVYPVSFKGLTVMVQESYEPSLLQFNYDVLFMFGGSVGDKRCLVKVVEGGA